MAGLQNRNDPHAAAYLEVLRQLDPSELSRSQKSLLAREQKRREQEHHALLAAARRADREAAERERARRTTSAALPPIRGLLNPQVQSREVQAIIGPGLRRRAESNLEQLQNATISTQAQQREYAKDLTDKQARIRELDADIARLREQLAQQLDVTPERQEQFRREFNRLRLLPGVVSVRFDTKEPPCFIVQVQPRVEHQGITYDYGDWEIKIPLNGSMYARCTREGLIRKGLATTLAGGFCLGTRSDAVYRLTQRFEILEAVTLYIEGLHALHRYDQHSYPIAEYFAPTNQIPTMKAV